MPELSRGLFIGSMPSFCNINVYKGCSGTLIPQNVLYGTKSVAAGGGRRLGRVKLRGTSSKAAPVEVEVLVEGG